VFADAFFISMFLYSGLNTNMPGVHINCQCHHPPSLDQLKTASFMGAKQLLLLIIVD
jgi:hypothetical protein